MQVRGNVNQSRMMFMPSSVSWLVVLKVHWCFVLIFKQVTIFWFKNSSLVALQLYDQYFLASSMDGTVRFAYSFT